MTLYKLYETVSGLGVGGWLSVLFILSLFIEITPFIKLNPIAWLGERLNATMYKRVDKIEAKLDEHIAQSYRDKILAFQDSLLIQGCSTFTKEQYDEVIDAITKYEKYCKDNEIDNDKCVLAISYINRCYTECQNNRSFSNLPATPH